jgi:peptide deformylase
MAVLKIITAPNSLLSQVSNEIANINDDIKKLATDMMETMYEENGIGLSAVQIGVLKRIITIDVTQERDASGNLLQKGEQFVMINPKIINASKEKSDFEEGCLSFPREHVKITRPSEITVKFTNLEGKEEEIKTNGLLSVCIQHEIDHLNGITISNYISHLRKEMMMKRLLKYKKTF